MIEYLSSDQTFGASHNKFIQNVLKEQLFIELLVAILMKTLPKLKDLEELKATEISRKNRKRKTRKDLPITMKIFMDDLKNDIDQEEGKSEPCNLLILSYFMNIMNSKLII